MRPPPQVSTWPSSVAAWNPRLAGIYFCRVARIRRRDRTLGNLLQNPSGNLSIGTVAVIDLPPAPASRQGGSWLDEYQGHTASAEVVV